MKTRLKNAWLALQGKPVIKEVEVQVVAKRNFLGSIDKEQVQLIKKLSKTELIEHHGSIAGIYKNKAFQLELNSMADTQVYWMGQEVDGDRMHLFGKGTLNGIQLVLERFKMLSAETDDKNKPADKFDDPLERYGILSDFTNKYDKD